MTKRRPDPRPLLEAIFETYLVDRASDLTPEARRRYEALASQYVGQNLERLSRELQADAEEMVAAEDEAFWGWASGQVSGLTRRATSLYGVTATSRD